MRKTKEFHAIIVAAGQGARFGGTCPKQYARLASKPLLRHVIERFMQYPGLKTLQVVIHPDHEDFYKNAVHGLELPRPIIGGKDRKESVYNALMEFSHVKEKDVVLVHDAARPLVTEKDIAAVLGALENHAAASLGQPVSDTLRRGDEIVERDGVWTMQTPQGFHYGVLKKAHEMADGAFTDDTGLVSALGIPVKLVEGSKTNIKITRAEDFELAERLLGSGETRTGMGYDVHAFSKDKSRKLILCGVEIDHDCGLEGHSDADVGLHALTDAILGAAGCGDIGQHFPPSNAKYRDMNSRIFLEAACRMVKGVIQNVDVTLICEMPKIGPHREKMQRKVAEILGIDTSRVNIKATTTEGLGFTGRGEGIAAQAIATIRIIP